MKLNDFGDTMTGPLLLEGPMTDPAEAVNKAYVDAAIAAPVVGVTDGTDAAPGTVGEYLNVYNITGLSMTANAPLAVCTMPLPPGCWEVWGACDFEVLSVDDPVTRAGQPIQPNQIGVSVSLHPDALPSQDELIVGTGVLNLIYSPLAAGQRQVLITGQCRSNSTEPIDLYLVAQIGLGNVNVTGYVSARRMR
jgi:hypothetical protein